MIYAWIENDIFDYILQLDRSVPWYLVTKVNIEVWIYVLYRSLIFVLIKISFILCVNQTALNSLHQFPM